MSIPLELIRMTWMHFLLRCSPPPRRLLFVVLSQSNAPSLDEKSFSRNRTLMSFVEFTRESVHGSNYSTWRAISTLIERVHCGKPYKYQSVQYHTSSIVMHSFIVVPGITTRTMKEGQRQNFSVHVLPKKNMLRHVLPQ